MKKIYALILILFLVPSFVFGQEKKKALYFFSETCSHCERVNEYFQSNGIFDRYDIRKMSVSDQSNLELLGNFFDALNMPVEQRGYPIIFFGNKFLIGDQPIIDNFVKEIDATDAQVIPTPDGFRKIQDEKNAAVGSTTPVAVNSVGSVHLFLLISAAFVDAMNPCALAVLILLLATVIAAKGKNSALLAGMLFSFAIFISYFLMGYGAYKAITAFSLPKYISLGVGIFSILIGLANLKDVFWPAKFFVMEVPMSWRPRMQGLLKSVTSPLGAFGVGFLVSLFLVPCASGPYLSILGLLATKGYTTGTISLLVLYNLVFVSPMIIITLAMYFFNAKMGKLEAWRKSHNWLLHSITGAVMFFIGAYLIYGWLK